MRDDFRVSPSPSTVLVGDNVVLRCVPPKAVPPAVVSWTRDGSTLSLDSAKRARVDDDGNLVILNAGKEDEGRYACAATNAAAVRVAEPVRVRVLGEFRRV